MDTGPRQAGDERVPQSMEVHVAAIAIAIGQEAALPPFLLLGGVLPDFSQPSGSGGFQVAA